MAVNSSIEWTQATWNPVTGCSKVGPGCRNCYAERLAVRLRAMGNPRYRNGFRVTLHPDLIELPKRWREPRLIFVNSMSDLFHEQIPIWFIERVFVTMRDCPQHTFQVLTKRSARLRQLAARFDWPANVWMGVTIEDADALHRLDDIRAVPASIRFISFEPLIGPVGNVSLENIHWVIVGGESGPGARPMRIEWIRDIFRQCRNTRVPFFFKQWGGVRKDLTGRQLGGRTYDEMPRRPSTSKRKREDIELLTA